MKKYYFLLFVFLTAAGLWADAAEPAAAFDARFIREIIIIQNEPVRTRESALRRFLDLEAGQVFETSEHLDEAVGDQIQELNNTRYYDFVDVTFQELDAMEGMVPVVVTVTLTDGWTLVPIPYPIPNSQIGQNGWEFGSELHYNNLFGTMYDFYFDGYVKMAFGEEDKVKQWELNPVLSNIDFGRFSMDIEFSQMYETVQKEQAENLGEYDQLYTKHSSFISLATTVDIVGDLSYEFIPAVGFNYGYDWQVLEGGNTHATDESGNYLNREDIFSLKFDHGLVYGRIDWDGPYRNGYQLKLANNNHMNVSQAAESSDRQLYFITDIEATASWYRHFWKRLNYYTQVQGFVAFNDIYTDLGERMRGVKNSTMSGNAGVFWQNSLGIQPFRERRGFNFQLHPFLDAGATFDYRDLDEFNELLRLGAGSEFIFTVAAVDIRVVLGYDFTSGFVDFGFYTDLCY
ncbi:MAG: ShlB/FhaC/HecB family hemolysin secretion/activation protein [Spirochaetales bacterium]|nr:ShlB/FhaC/HecB family hemolysin secretion/activation protein [Spirochaetales bacterium]